MTEPEFPVRAARQAEHQQVQSSADPPKKLDLGKRAVMADGNEYNIFQMNGSGRPVDDNHARMRGFADRCGRNMRHRPQRELYQERAATMTVHARRSVTRDR